MKWNQGISDVRKNQSALEFGRGKTFLRSVGSDIIIRSERSYKWIFSFRQKGVSISQCYVLCTPRRGRFRSLLLEHSRLGFCPSITLLPKDALAPTGTPAPPRGRDQSSVSPTRYSKAPHALLPQGSDRAGKSWLWLWGPSGEWQGRSIKPKRSEQMIAGARGARTLSTLGTDFFPIPF